MTLLFRYLFKMFTKNLLLVLASFAGIYLLIDFFERIDNFLEKNLPFSLAAKYFLCKLPLIAEQLLPVSIMLAGIVTVGLLHHNRELLSLQAAGIGMPRIVRPVFLAALFITLLGLASSQWLMPTTQSEVNRIWYQKVNQLVPTGILRSGMIFYKGSEGFYTVGQPHGDEKNAYTPFSYISWDKSFGFKQLITARMGRWSDGRWQLTDGIRKSADKEGKLEVQPFEEQSISLPEGPDTLLAPPYRAEELSLSELYRNSHSAREQERSEAGLKLSEKLSYISLGIPLLFIGLPVLLAICRSQKRDLSLAIPVSFLLAFLVWGVWGVLQSLAKTAYIPTFVAAWLVHLVIITSGIGFIRRFSRS